MSDKDRDGHALSNRLCLDCGLVFVDPRPSRQQREGWYAHDYRRDYNGVLQPRSHHVLRAGRVALDRLLRIRPLLTGHPRMLKRLGMHCGLSPVSARASPDGGNVDVVFQRDERREWSPALIDAHTQDYGRRVQRVLDGHTRARHHLSWRPAWRTLKRLYGQFGERAAVLRQPKPKAILDALIVSVQPEAFFPRR